MTFYNPEEETEVHVDFHVSGLGAVLTQKDSEGNWRPKMYCSRSTTDAESRYSQTEGEAPSVKWACERLRVFLIGTRFTVVTDHKPLVVMFNNPYKTLPIRISRMMTYLQEFDFNTVYKPGKENISDYLSRHAGQPKEHSDLACQHDDLESEVTKLVRGLFSKQVPKAVTIDMVQEETSKDEVLLKIQDIIRSEAWDKHKNDQRFQPYFRVKD